MLENIKVGQIYTYRGEPFVITKVSMSHQYEDTVDLFYQDGTKETLWIASVAGNPLIAEYPTVEEAINSKEFNGE
jgi:hypothetical protein